MSTASEPQRFISTKRLAQPLGGLEPVAHLATGEARPACRGRGEYTEVSVDVARAIGAQDCQRCIDHQQRLVDGAAVPERVVGAIIRWAIR